MIKVKDGYAKLIGTTYQGSATQVLLSNGGDLEYSASSKASTLVQRNASQHIYATYFNSAISDEALTDIGSVYVRNTSDTFIRRVSKTQFYSILDDKFVTLDTTQSITGAKTFSTSVRFANNASIIQNQNDTSNYTIILKWYKNGASRNTYDPSIGQHNTGGDGNGSICILPYPTETSPWGGTVGLFISKGVLKLDGKSVALAENYYTKTESDERYVNVTGDTMTGPLIVKAAITGTQLISTIATGTSPLKVTSTTVVTNLNSDLLDGLHETSFFRARGDQSIASSVPTTTELATSNNLCGSWNVKYTGASGHLVQFNAGSGSTRYMQFYSTYSGSLYWRNSTDSTLNTKSWKTIVDSANYTGIVLKIGTATKGSATLPIYLNAGTPTACSTTLGVSITGNAATANRILSHTISDTLANKTTPGYLYHAGGSNSVADKPSGVDAFGVFTMQTAPGWYGQILMSSNTSTGLYWRTATTLSGGWKKILDSSNYTAYINPANFVTALGTSGNYLTWTKNGVVNNLTVPYATASSRINSSSSVQNTGLTYYSSGGFVVGGTAAGGQWGMPSDSQDAVYKNGQCLRMYWGSTYYTDILSGPNNMGTTHGLYMRQIVNGAVATGTFAGGWRLILDSYNYHRYGDTRYVTSLGTNGTYVTWVKNGTTNNITVPYATNSNKANYIYYGSISNLNSPSSWTSDGYRLVYDTYSGSASNKPVLWDNANGIITLFKSKHGTSNQYVSQLAFPNNTRMYFRYASAGSFSSWYTIAYTSDIKDPANYYWANVKVSASSNSETSPTFSTAYTSNWFRSTGSTGWYSQTYGGGIYMTDSTYVRVYNSKIFYASAGYLAPYTGSSWISMATRSNCIVADQNNSTSSAHCLFRAKYNNGNALCFGGLGNDLGFYGFSATDISNGTNSYAWIAKWNSGGSFFNTGSITAAGGFYHNSVNSNNYVLLAGGSYKSLTDFAKGNAGASNRGVYVTNGTVTAMTYYLNATVNSGASGKLAYYSGTNSIDDYTNTIGSSSTPIYINNGIPNAANSYKVVNSGRYFSAFGISGYIYVIRYGQVVCVSINMSSGGNGSTGTTTLLTNLPSAVYTTGQSASKGGGSVLRQATFYVSGTTLYVYSYQANQLPNKVSFTYITNTLE